MQQAKDERWDMHYGANKVIFQRAEELRARMTPAEETLWLALRKNEWNVKFRRQHPLSKYIADFYCHSVKLVIEIDGGYHLGLESRISDEIREDEIKHFGITIIRFTNEEVLNRIEITLK